MRPPCCPMDLHCDTQNVRVCRAVTLRARRRLPLHKWGAVSPIRHLFATDQRPARVVGGRRLPDPVVREGRASMTGVGGAVLPDPSMPRIRRRGIYRAGVQRATQRVAPTRFGDASLVRRPGASNGRCSPSLVGIRRCLDPPARAGRRTSAQRDGHGMAPMVERTGGRDSCAAGEAAPRPYMEYRAPLRVRDRAPYRCTPTPRRWSSARGGVPGPPALDGRGWPQRWSAIRWSRENRAAKG